MIQRGIGRAIALLVFAAMQISAGAQPVPTPAASSCLEGVYDGSQREIAAELYLRENGQFDYGFAYGALNEESHGSWKASKDSVQLTSDPFTVPRFLLLSDKASQDSDFRIDLDVPDGMSRQYFDAEVTLADGTAEPRQLSESGLALHFENGEQPISVRMMLPLFDLVSDPFAVTQGGARSLRIRFEPNDLGKVSLDGQPLRRENGVLVFERYGRTIHFRPVQGGCAGDQSP